MRVGVSRSPLRAVASGLGLYKRRIRSSGKPIKMVDHAQGWQGSEDPGCSFSRIPGADPLDVSLCARILLRVRAPVKARDQAAVRRGRRRPEKGRAGG